MHVMTVIVTYNRKQLLERCLHAMVNQIRKPDHILIVNNASTDGTVDMLAEQGWLERADIEIGRASCSERVCHRV